MTPHTYAPGDLVKIISMEEVRKYPKDIAGWRSIGSTLWREEMDWLAGTTQEIEFNCGHWYEMKRKNISYSFSPEMIAGPAEAPEPVTDREKYADPGIPLFEHCTKCVYGEDMDLELDAFSKETGEYLCEVIRKKLGTTAIYPTYVKFIADENYWLTSLIGHEIHRWLDDSTPPEKTYTEEERLEYRSLLLNISMNAGLNKRWMDNIETLLAKYDK